MLLFCNFLILKGEQMEKATTSKRKTATKEEATIAETTEQPVKKEVIKKDNKLAEQARRDEFLKRQEYKIQKAQERGSVVLNIEQPESMAMIDIIRNVDRLFKKGRTPRANIVNIKEMEAQLIYREAIVEFSQQLQLVAKMLDKDFRPSATLKSYKSKLSDDKAKFDIIKEAFAESDNK